MVLTSFRFSNPDLPGNSIVILFGESDNLAVPVTPGTERVAMSVSAFNEQELQATTSMLMDVPVDMVSKPASWVQQKVSLMTGKDFT